MWLLLDVGLLYVTVYSRLLLNSTWLVFTFISREGCFNIRKHPHLVTALDADEDVNAVLSRPKFANSVSSRPKRPIKSNQIKSNLFAIEYTILHNIKVHKNYISFGWRDRRQLWRRWRGTVRHGAELRKRAANRPRHWNGGQWKVVWRVIRERVAWERWTRGMEIWEMHDRGVWYCK